VRAKEKSEQWTVGEARANLPGVFKAAAKRPQRVFRRKEPAAVIVSPAEFAELAALRAEGTIAEAFAELRELGARLEVLPRRDRRNAFSVRRR
jgi:PHD/YefM family antitoxin component YafN of YafNO toxin-antitoxin module